MYSQSSAFLPYRERCEQLGLQVGDHIQGGHRNSPDFDGEVLRLPTRNFPNIWIEHTGGEWKSGVLPDWITHINGRPVNAPRTVVVEAEILETLGPGCYRIRIIRK
jgi:hypothetical protein